MAKDVSGSIRKLTIEGVSYRVTGDANFTEIITRFENSMIPTSGKSMRKMVRRTPAREGIVLSTNGAERESLKAQAEDLANQKFSYTNAAGDVYRCEGTFEIENNETEDNRTAIQIMPDDDWTFFEG